jgi:predicted HTH transcriptional regulator
MKRIFISSVQKEFAKIRKQLKRLMSRNPVFHRVFDSFVFEEDVVACDRRTDELYIDELKKCDIYIGLIGNEYGYEDAEGVSPTEREFDEATRLGLKRLIFVIGKNDESREIKEIAFLKKVSNMLIRARCEDESELLPEISASLDGLVLEQGGYRIGPFDASICEGATMADIDSDKVDWFVERARRLRNADIEEGMSPESVLKHLKLYSSETLGGLTNSAILLFGCAPQRFCLSSEVKCVQWHGKERHKPMLSYQIYKGTLFDMADAAVTFVLSKLDLRVGTRSRGIEAPREYEIPISAVSEAIINAIAHRDYTSTGSVQVELFSDRLVVRNPGTINPALSKDDLFVEHASYPNNSLIADQLYQTKHIEKFGTGLTDLIHDCRAAGLKDPEIDDSRSEFVITIWRPTSCNSCETTTNKLQIKDIKDSEIIALILRFPNLSVSELANKLQIKYSELRYRIDQLRQSGILKREGARKKGRWVLTNRFDGCKVDGQVVVKEDIELDPSLTHSQLTHFSS